MTKFAKHMESDPDGKLFDALEGHRPFRRFKDTLYELNLWGEWNKFESKYAEEVIQSWMEKLELDYNEFIKEGNRQHPEKFRNNTYMRRMGRLAQRHLDRCLFCCSNLIFDQHAGISLEKTVDKLP